MTEALRTRTDTVVSARVGQWLADNDRSIRWLAPRVNMSDPTLGRKLRGDNGWTIDEVERLATFLGITPSQLIADDDTEGRLTDVGAAQPTALGVAVLFLLAVLLGWTLPAGTPVELLLGAAAAVVLVGVVRGCIAAERARRPRPVTVHVYGRIADDRELLRAFERATLRGRGRRD